MVIAVAAGAGIVCMDVRKLIPGIPDVFLYGKRVDLWAGGIAGRIDCDGYGWWAGLQGDVGQSGEESRGGIKKPSGLVDLKAR